MYSIRLRLAYGQRIAIGRGTHAGGGGGALHDLPVAEELSDHRQALPQRQRRRSEGVSQVEAGVRSDFHSGGTWSPRGRTPVVSTTGARFGANLISAISAQGKLRFMVAPGRVTAAVFIEFLKRLLVNAPSPVFLIVDGHPTHKAKVVKRFVEEQDGALELYYLPPYSPS